MQLLVALLISLLASMGCGGRYDVVVSGGAKIEPSLDNLAEFFRKQCRDQLGPSAAEQDVAQCTQSELGKLVDFLTSLEK